MTRGGMVAGSSLSEAIEIGAGFLKDNDLDFYRRVWNSDLDVYRNRLRAIRFVGMENVLDAGCGFGQWTLCLAELNKYVYGIDVSPARIRTVKSIVQSVGVGNVEVSQQTIEQTCYADATFDGIFCYSALYVTDFNRTLREFFRILRPGGALYICSNGPGWCVYNLVRGRNKARDYSPRRFALRAIRNTLAYALFKRHSPGNEIIIPSWLLRRKLEAVGFEGVAVAPEGTIRLCEHSSVRQFFEGSYMGLENVYEILAYKKNHV